MSPDAEEIRSPLAAGIEAGILGLLVLSPLPAASVYGWSILAIQVVVLGLAAAWVLMRNRPRPNPIMEDSLRTPRLLALAFFVFTALQAAPLPTALVRILSPGGVSLRSQSSAGPLPSFVSLSLIPSETLRAGSELLAYFLLAFLVTKTVTSTARIRRLMGVVVAAGVFEACYGIVSLYGKGRLAAFNPKRRVSIPSRAHSSTAIISRGISRWLSRWPSP